jgi:hypothetical protein
MSSSSSITLSRVRSISLKTEFSLSFPILVQEGPTVGPPLIEDPALTLQVVEEEAPAAENFAALGK